MSEQIPEVNIGLVGHVDHGKTTLTRALSGKWTDEHSEELKKGITIKIGYADITYYRNDEGTLNVKEDGEKERTVSLVDAPGHETLMANVLSGAAIMDGAVLVIAANEECPQPQTREHLAALDIIGVENIVIVQNKIDLVDEEEARENYKEIQEFVEGTVAEDAPVIPISAQQEINIDAVLEAIDTEIQTPERDLEADGKMLVARSFDINKPGTSPEGLHGGVVGGSLVEGELEVGDEIELSPGINQDEEWRTVKTEIKSIMHGGNPVEKGTPGGLLAIETDLDPSMAKSDGLSGNILGKEGTLPETTENITVEVDLMDRAVGSEQEKEIENIKQNEPLMLNVGTSKSAGIVTQAGKKVKLDLKVPICAEEDDRIAISRQIGSRWRLIGYGKIIDKE
ncbi:translation initiation factor IF-2 subunit gamma [Candidatus Nanohalovita haloferacivicina]|uniref:translation initiation factor IF-2 subunit gamma n=1 Tax=Candidatus Nanohalovita haloferacivicina TaxID=2978046 RepID=UPI00325F9A99|nr:Translation initiation factor IF-2 subunit gamma [Candidatus Nanohalobia archaeon BNXNv]